MAVARTAPRCYTCGEPYNAVHLKLGKTFVGDNFSHWDIDGHKCDRSGIVYFCEHKETHEWYCGLSNYTRDPFRAKFWRNKDDATQWLATNNKTIYDAEGQISGHVWADCEITEHIFDNV